MDTSLERTAENVADGSHVLWDRLLADSHTGDERSRVENLRAIQAVFEAGRQPVADNAARQLARPIDPVNESGSSESWGKYQLIEEVGSGSYGAVYRARDPELQLDRAIKILHQHVADERTKARLLSEARALASVNDPNVVRVIGVEAHDNRIGLCMEFVNGDTLESIVSSLGRMSAREALDVAEHVCRALCAVHHAGFVHRDVKARNIMRSEGGRFLLMDFGTGRRMSDPTAIDVAGTPLYMAPEVLAGEPPLPSGDIYSVGVLLYYLVTGEYPVNARTLDQVRSAHMLRRYVPVRQRRPDLPTSFVRIVERALAPDPGQRYADPATMLDSIVGALETPGLAASARVNVWAIAGGVLVGVPTVLTLLGMLSSRYYNATLARADFADETMVDWLVWGARSFLAPLVILVLTTMGIGFAVIAGKLVWTVFPVVRRLERRIVEFASAHHLDTANAYSMFALAASSTVLYAAWWHSVPFLESLVAVSNISTVDSLGKVGILSPALGEDHNEFRKWFTAAVVTWCVLWLPFIVASVRLRLRLNWLLLSAALAVLIVGAFWLELPYRLLSAPPAERMSTRHDFERASWNGRDCFVLGTRGDTLLLFCPQLPVPRTRMVQATSDGLTRTGERKDLFSDMPLPIVTRECRIGVVCRRVYATAN